MQKGFKRPVSKFVSPEKIIYVPNTSNLNFDKYKKNRIYMDKEKFNLVFLGNLGEFQGLKIIIDAAKKLEKEKRLKIVICGMGSKFQWLNRNIKNFNLTNIELKGWVDPIFIPDIMSQASALLITLKDGEALSKTIPSKIQTYLAIGKPIIASLNGSGAKILLESNSGYVSKAEQVEPLDKKNNEFK